MPNTDVSRPLDAKTSWLALLDSLRQHGFGETFLRTLTSRAEAMAKQREQEMLSSIATAQKAVEPIRSLAAVERMAILNALIASNGNIVKAAELLGVGKTTVYRKMKQYTEEQNGEGSESSNSSGRPNPSKRSRR